MNVKSGIRAEHPRLDLSLAEAADAMHLHVSSEQSARLIEFLELLQRWNRTYNLTAVRDTFDMLALHVLDCLAAVFPLRRELTRLGSARILDVGSGGGLPGLVFAVMQPEAAVTCIDSVGKKTAFIRQAAATLKLQNVDVETGRVEGMIAPRFDVIVSRAFSSLAEFTRLTAGLLRDSGVWMAMKGRRPDDEILSLPASVEMFHVEPLIVPGLQGQRCLVWMQPAAKLSPMAGIQG